MFKFNSEHILTGYIKQLLASFNLPKYRVYTRKNAEYFKNHKEEHFIVESKLPEKDSENFPEHLRIAPYIRNGEIQICIDNKKGTWQKIGGTYYYNKKELNFTKNLEIKNGIYDSYTHEYLGDFLRFQRDYNNIDLMPLYNCFSNRLANNLNIECNHTIEIEEAGKRATVTNTHFTFTTADNNYRIYMLPVKMFQKYTIALDCSGTVEICCDIFGAYQDTREQFDEIPCLTYQKFTNMSFSSPILYTKLVDMDDWMNADSATELAQNECNLKMFIKLPVNSKTSITVLEGDYIHWTDASLKTNGNIAVPNTKMQLNHNIINFSTKEGQPELNDRVLTPVTALQLLKLNTKESYPFADRLIEYLLDNVITDQDTLSDNIKRVQKIMSENKIDNMIAGAWDNKMQHVLYDFMYDENSNILDRTSVCHDILGYVDKDVENSYKSRRPILNADGEIVDYETINTLKDVDIYENLYLSNKIGGKK